MEARFDASLYPEEKRIAKKERMEGTREGGGLIVIALSEKHETCNCRCMGMICDTIGCMSCAEGGRAIPRAD